MTGGLLGLAAVLASALLWTLHTAVWTLALTLMAMAYLDEQRGSIHESKAGVGSAMNDVNRQVGGALGVAIISSIVNSVYRSGVSDAVAQLPAGARHAARDSIGSAHAVAQHLRRRQRSTWTRRRRARSPTPWGRLPGGGDRGGGGRFARGLAARGARAQPQRGARPVEAPAQA